MFPFTCYVMVLLVTVLGLVVLNFGLGLEFWLFISLVGWVCLVRMNCLSLGLK